MMEKNEKITIGYEIPKEVWRATADNIEVVAQWQANYLRKLNHDGLGEEDAQECLANFQLALMAMRYVADFATDKCRIIPIPDGGFK